MSYLRYPDVHGDDVVFVADNDLWLVSLAGGRPWRLTDVGRNVRRPLFSPDGTHIAFGSGHEDIGDVYVLDRRSGELTRVTHLGHPNVRPAGWTADGRVIVSQPDATRTTRLVAYSLNGQTERLPYGIAMSVVFGPDGAVATVTPNYRDSAMWKRYRGGTAAKLWLDRRGEGNWIDILGDEAAGKYSPGFFGDRLFFCADIGEFADLPQAQLWSVDLAGEDLRQHTHHTDSEGYVRDPRTDGTTIVYHAHGVLYAMAGLDTKPRVIPVDLRLPAPRLSAGIHEVCQIRPDFGANGSVLDWRGAAYYLTHRGGPARALAATPGVRARHPRVLGQSGNAVWVSDADGVDALEVGALDGTGTRRRIAVDQLGYILDLEPNPEGTVVAAVSHDGRVSTVNVATGRVTTLQAEANGEVIDLAWSPDGRYLAWRDPRGIQAEFGAIVVSDTMARSVAARAPQALTTGDFDDFSPAFSADGKFLTFLSSRTFDPRYDAHTFDLSFGDSVRPYLIVLDPTEPAPFGPTADGWAISEVIAARAAEAGTPLPEESEVSSDAKTTKATAPTPTTKIVVDGIADRILAFPVPVGDYRDLRAVKDGMLWIRVPSTGTLGLSRVGVEGEGPRPVLERYSFTARKLDVIVQSLDTYAVAGNGTHMVVRDKDQLLVVPTERAVTPEDPMRVSVDVSRLRREIDLRAEWAQMFAENHRIMRDHYWRADMDGNDWEAIGQRYGALIDGLATRDDLIDVLWETVGELNTSHAYIWADPATTPGPHSCGLLGADLKCNSKGEVLIERIVPGDTSNPHARSPLLAPGVNAKVGEMIVAVDGHRVDSRDSRTTLAALLEGSAHKVVELTIRGTGRGAGERRVAVVPLWSETDLRYQDWVESRRAYVEAASQSRLGYVHIPDMGAYGWAQFHRYLDKAMQHEGVIIDVRYNGGGHTSQLILERLARKIGAWNFGRHYSQPMPYPYQAPRGPVVLVTNQFAGSDGDIVSAMCQAMQLGPVIGERSWGGVIGIDGRFGLVDGLHITQPRYAGYFGTYGWGVENHGVDPDIEVPLTPADWESDDDVQLDVAVAEAFRLLAKAPAAVAPELPAARIGTPPKKRGAKR